MVTSRQRGCPGCRGLLGYGPVSFAAPASGKIRPVERLNNQQILDAGLADWRKLSQPLHTRYLVPHLAEAAGFVAAVVKVVGADSRHLEMRLVHGVIDLSLCTREDGLFVTQTDIDLAKKISAIALASGLEADPSAVTQLEVGLDTAHEDKIGQFWSVLLTGSSDNKVSDSVFDPTSRVPAIWFQGTVDHETPRQRWHFDLWLASEVVDERIAAAVSAGGSVIDTSGAPSFTVLADPDGNRVCVCTATGR
jgi:4a-hydroxytetrahydrobiopterin dehydratase